MISYQHFNKFFSCNGPSETLWGTASPFYPFWWMYLQTDKWIYRTSFISGTCFFVPGIIPQPPAIPQTPLQSQRGLRNASWHLRNSARHKETGPRMRLCPIPAFVRPYVCSSEGIEGAYSSSEGLWWSIAAEKFVWIAGKKSWNIKQTQRHYTVKLTMNWLMVLFGPLVLLKLNLMLNLVVSGQWLRRRQWLLLSLLGGSWSQRKWLWNGFGMSWEGLWYSWESLWAS